MSGWSSAFDSTMEQLRGVPEEAWPECLDALSACSSPPESSLLQSTPIGFSRLISRPQRLVHSGPQLFVDAQRQEPRRICGQNWPPSRQTNQVWPLDASFSMNHDVHVPPPLLLPHREQQVVELGVSNLDQKYALDDLKQILIEMFTQVARLEDVKVFVHSDNSASAIVRVYSAQDAQMAIAKLQRAKLGSKRIVISNNPTRGDEMSGGFSRQVRDQVVSLLQEAPRGKIVPVILFREMYERRYNTSVSVSELHRIRDVVLSDHGRMIQLNPNIQSMPNLEAKGRRCLPPSATNPSHKTSATEGQQFCSIHFKPKDTKTKLGWAERQECSILPNVTVGLRALGPRLLQLIKDHNGTVPLLSLVDCYDQSFPNTKLVVEMESGVPLEHLVTCVKGVVIKTFGNGNKGIVLNDEELINNNSSFKQRLNASLSGSTASLTSLISTSSAPSTATAGSGVVGTPLVTQLSTFSRELVDLLKSTKGARMAFHKFIPSYHHFFGRQCRVADYGYTRLRDLLSSIPHVVQLLGEGSRTMVTLSHRAQMKRFNSDVIKMLKMQPELKKSMKVAQLPQTYEKCFNVEFDVTDYGVCELEDLLLELSETSSVLLTTSNENLCVDDLLEEGELSLPKREQTMDESRRTQQFRDECVELLRHAPDFRMNFNKFIPNYHHHFGRQCRVADYGFSKLMELFEAINTTVEVSEDADGERLLQLSDVDGLRVLGQQICQLIDARGGSEVKLNELADLYSEHFGFQLRPENFGKRSIQGLLGMMSSTLRIEGDEGAEVVRVVDKQFVSLLRNRVKSMLVEAGTMKLDLFLDQYEKRFGEEFDTKVLQQDLSSLVEIVKEPGKDSNNNGGDEKKIVECSAEDMNNNKEKEECQDSSIIRLLSLELCAARIELLIEESGVSKISLSDLESSFPNRFGVPLSSGQFGFSSVVNLIQIGLRDRFAISGRANKKFVNKLTKESDHESAKSNVKHYAEWVKQSAKKRASKTMQESRPWPHQRRALGNESLMQREFLHQSPLGNFRDGRINQRGVVQFYAQPRPY